MLAPPSVSAHRCSNCVPAGGPFADLLSLTQVLGKAFHDRWAPRRAQLPVGRLPWLTLADWDGPLASLDSRAERQDQPRRGHPARRRPGRPMPHSGPQATSAEQSRV